MIAGANPNTVWNDVNAIQFAAMSGRDQALEWLLESPLADLAAVSSDAVRATALHLAAMRGQLSTVLILLAAGAPWDARDAEGRLPEDVSTDEDITVRLRTLRQSRELDEGAPLASRPPCVDCD